MGRKKIGDSTKPKRKAVRRTIELKKELIAKFESGTRISDLATQYGMAKSTISSILKNKDIIKEANVAKGVTILAVNRSTIIEQMEKLLLVWINEKQLAGDSISETIMCEKAKRLHDDLKRDSPGTSAQTDKFKASRGWFDQFKKRSSIHSAVRRGEAASANKDAAEKFVGEFKNCRE
ncbi:putative CENPB DNA-binding domain-containing protein 1 [Oratosquilla oratoria]|uniref:putative CENPB DNA-binding domain-containing protein 1 n=1 Tax=Oratosquilla oratoria TaxID=337810 RepID=UPI003F770055